MGTVHILECVRQSDSVKSVLNVTTDKVYENCRYLWGYRETDRLNGLDPYSNSKSCSELITDSYRGSFLRACLKSSNEDGNEGKRENLSRNIKFAFTISPKSAEFVEPAEKTLYHPAAWQNDKLV